ncbi:unnamed protein product [Plutella xylostella]|uniref:(diamondback moth) hypothetical protein n=1 Tax=Plutella xylostella TaxID=51655 RepID=A0A8S4E414_PLUXY|nr:unnamed protein product [Plutella xylostella]
MPFKRDWDATCPITWSQWEEDGVSWLIQDLPPQHDALVVDMLVEQFLPDEVMCNTTGVHKEPAGVADARLYWNGALGKRTSLACYRVIDGVKELVAANVCPVKCLDDDDSGGIEQYKSTSFLEVVKGLDYIEEKAQALQVLGVDKYLGGAGLVVRRDARGARLGGRLLQAREPLCRHLGIDATVTTFTVPPSQKLATKVGFKLLTEVSFSELAEAGLNFPKDSDVVMKVMAKMYK